MGGVNDRLLHAGVWRIGVDGWRGDRFHKDLDPVVAQHARADDLAGDQVTKELDPVVVQRTRADGQGGDRVPEELNPIVVRRAGANGQGRDRVPKDHSSSELWYYIVAGVNWIGPYFSDCRLLYP